MSIELTYDIEREWVAALRSGEYKQATGSLYRESEDAFCCLGVLGCLLAAKGLMSGHEVSDDEIRFTETTSDAPLDAPDTPYEIAMRRYGNNHPLVNWNDQKKLSFKQIADVIDSGRVYLEREGQ